MKEIFIGYNNTLNERERDSSGGIYSSIANLVLSSGGVIYAAVYNQDLMVEHKRITSLHDLHESLGSKYVTSSLGDTFKLIKTDLLNGKTILFVGTPCQCAGLRAFIGDQERLYLVDFVCHGVPGKAAWKYYLNSFKADEKVISEVNMRDKTNGWNNYGWKFVYSNGMEQFKERDSISFYIGFVNNLYLRPSCYSCHFKGLNRITDITLGDAWGVDGYYKDAYNKKGTSLIMVHSQKGKELIEQCDLSLFDASMYIDAIIRNNGCIVQSVSYNKKEEQFYEMMKQGVSFDRIISKLTKENILDKVLRKIRKNASL